MLFSSLLFSRFWRAGACAQVYPIGKGGFCPKLIPKGEGSSLKAESYTFGRYGYPSA